MPRTEVDEHPRVELTPRRRPLRRDHWRRVVEELDPVRDAQLVHRITATLEFPWDYQRALELALLRTFCSPAVADVLEASGEFRERAQKRYDDTALLMATLVTSDLDSRAGREALRVVNRNHAGHHIDPDEMLYVLSTFVFEPIDWIDRYGWRPLTRTERLAAFHFYAEVGRRMAIRDVPEDPDSFRAWREAYEARHFRPSDSTVAVAGHTVRLVQSWFPRPLRPAARVVVHSVADETMRTCLGMPEPPRVARTAVDSALRCRALAVRMAPPRRRPVADRDRRVRSYPGYPQGYAVRDLGARR